MSQDSTLRGGDRTPLAATTGLCPDCLGRVPGRYETDGEAVFLTRTCDDHGTATRQVWASLDHWRWARETGPAMPSDPGDDAVARAEAVQSGRDGAGVEQVDGDDLNDRDLRADGEFAVAGDHACLAVVEVTEDCNLSCSYCFASSDPGGEHRPLAEVVGLLGTVKSEAGTRPVQLSGGEPTVRDDLPRIVGAARGMGFDHVQVNTNGLRLARGDGYAERLADAGVTAVYLQFDGLTAETYEAIREVDILAEKHAAVEACRNVDLPVVLVPTVVPGVNDDEMGDIVRFALENRDIVRSVNLQPVAHFGRYGKNEGRFSLDEAARRLAEQFEPLDARDLVPVPCCSSYCQLAAALVPRPGGAVSLTQFLDEEGVEAVAGQIDEADWIDMLAGTPAGRDRMCSAAGCCGGGGTVGSLASGLLDDLAAEVLPVTITGFMDADSADADRLEDCCISVPTPDGELVPFCGYNMTTTDGEYALRTRNGWGGRQSVDPGADAGWGAEADGGQPVEAVPTADDGGCGCGGSCEGR